MEWIKKISTLKTPPDYLILACSKYAGIRQNDRLKAIDYNQQLTDYLTLNRIVKLLTSDLWREFRPMTEKEARAQTLTRYLAVSKLSKYLLEDPETPQKFILEYNELKDPEKALVLDRYDKYLKPGKWITGLFLKNNKGLSNEWLRLDEFMERHAHIFEAIQARKKMENKTITIKTRDIDNKPNKPIEVKLSDIISNYNGRPKDYGLDDTDHESDADSENGENSYYRHVMNKRTPPGTPPRTPSPMPITKIIKPFDRPDRVKTPEHLKRSNNPAVRFCNIYPRGSKEREEQEEEIAKQMKKSAESDELAIAKAEIYAEARSVKEAFIKKLNKELLDLNTVLNTTNENENNAPEIKLLIKNTIEKLIEVETSLFITMENIDLIKESARLKNKLKTLRKKDLKNVVLNDNKEKNPNDEVEKQRNDEIKDDIKQEETEAKNKIETLDVKYAVNYINPGIKLFNDLINIKTSDVFKDNNETDNNETDNETKQTTDNKTDNETKSKTTRLKKTELT